MVLASAGVSCKLAALRQARALIRLKLRSSAHSQGFWGKRSGSDSGTDSGRSGLWVATIFIAAHAVITWARSLNHLSIGSAAGFGGSDRDFAAQHPQGVLKARRIRPLPPLKRTNPHPLAPLTSPPTPCGRAEQRRLGRIKILDVRRLRSRLVSKISAPAEQRKASRSEAQGP